MVERQSPSISIGVTKQDYYGIDSYRPTLISQNPSTLVFFENRSHSDSGKSSDERNCYTKPFSLILSSTRRYADLFEIAAIENPREESGEERASPINQMSSDLTVMTSFSK